MYIHKWPWPDLQQLFAALAIGCIGGVVVIAGMIYKLFFE
jgi:hypothetical protein